MYFIKMFQVIAFDELKSDYKNPIDQCNSLNPVSIVFTDFQLKTYLKSLH